jgi:hypothetical protein
MIIQSVWRGADVAQREHGVRSEKLCCHDPDSSHHTEVTNPIKPAHNCGPLLSRCSVISRATGPLTGQRSSWYSHCSPAICITFLTNGAGDGDGKRSGQTGPGYRVQAGCWCSQSVVLRTQKIFAVFYRVDQYIDKIFAVIYRVDQYIDMEASVCNV